MVSHGIDPWLMVQPPGPRIGVLGWVMMVQYKSLVMSQQAMVQNGNKGSDKKGKEKRKKKK